MNALTVGQQVPNYKIERGMRIAVELKNGARIAGKAAGRAQSGRGVSWYVTVRSQTHGTCRIDGEDIASITYMG